VDGLRRLIEQNQVDIPRPFGDPRRWPIERLRETYG
jgi:hypothetical protein